MITDEKLLNIFAQALNCQRLPSSGAYMHYFNNIRNPNIKHYIFVEGFTDVVFYKNNIYRNCSLKRNEICLIHNGKDGGKKAVIDLAEKIINEAYYKVYNKAISFIVDRDYDNNNSILNNKNRNNITVLPCYSFESFYFYCDNIEKLFCKLFKEKFESELNEFNLILIKFIDMIKEYSALKRTIVYHGIRLRLEDDNDTEDNLRKIHFKDDGIYLDDEFKNKVTQSIQYFHTQEDSEIYNDFLNKIEWLKNNRIYIKGKILFYFLIDYLNIKKHML